MILRSRFLVDRDKRLKENGHILTIFFLSFLFNYTFQLTRNSSFGMQRFDSIFPLSSCWLSPSLSLFFFCACSTLIASCLVLFSSFFLYYSSVYGDSVFSLLVPYPSPYICAPVNTSNSQTLSSVHVPPVNINISLHDVSTCTQPK